MYRAREFSQCSYKYKWYIKYTDKNILMYLHDLKGRGRSRLHEVESNNDPLDLIDGNQYEHKPEYNAELTKNSHEKLSQSDKSKIKIHFLFVKFFIKLILLSQNL